MEKVDAPQRKPASFNRLWDARRDFYTPFNIVCSKNDPEGITIFGKVKNVPIGTISLESLDHLIERLVEFRSEYSLWKTLGSKADRLPQSPE
jgi:hypothetical protein